MNGIDPLLAPGGLIREIALSWPVPDGMPCCGLTAILAMAQAGLVPVEAQRGSARLGPWKALIGRDAWDELMVNTGDPWSHLRRVQALLGGSLAIQATPAAPCPVLTPGSVHYVQRWLYGLEEGGHTYMVHHAPEGERPYYGGTPMRLVQSSKGRGFRDWGVNDWKVRGGSVFGVLTLEKR